MGDKMHTQSDSGIVCSEYASALVEHPFIDECAVLERTRPNKASELIAYFVAAGAWSPGELRERLSNCSARSEARTSFVPVSHLPLTSDGLLDQEALASLPVIDEELARREEGRLRELPGIQDAAVMIAPADYQQDRPLHMLDLVPGWTADATIDESEETSSDLKRPAKDAPDAPGKVDSRPALSEGGPITAAADIPASLAASLKLATEQHPEQGVVFIPPDGAESFLTYPELLAQGERILPKLRQFGLQPGDKVIFQFAEVRDFILAFWGCALGGFVCVPVAAAPSYAELNPHVSKLRNTWEMLEHPLILTNKLLCPSIRNLSKLYPGEEFRVEAYDGEPLGEADHEWHEPEPDELAVMMLTSGSTGLPKGVMLSHHNVLSRSLATKELNGLGDWEISLNWMPMDHVAGLVYFHIRDVCLGYQQILGAMELVLQNPLQWLEWIDRFRATITFAPNFAYGLVNDHAKEMEGKKWDLSTMRFFMNAGEAVVAKTARRFVDLLLPFKLPPTAMCPAWGMSETSSAVTFSNTFTLDSTSDDDSFVEVGAPLPGFAMRIVDENDRPLTLGEIGRLQVKGETVTAGYYRRDELNQESFTADGWFRTGDLAFLQAPNRQDADPDALPCLTITGREKDVIIINGINYYCHEIEGVVDEIDGVTPSFSAACGVRPPGSDTDRVAVFFTPTDEGKTRLAELRQTIRQKVIQGVGVVAEYILPVREEDIPKTTIGKIQRPQLAKQFNAGEFAEVLKETDVLEGNANTLPAWFFQPVWRRKELEAANQPAPSGGCLFFLDELGLGQLLRDDFLQQGTSEPCVGVKPGADFARLPAAEGNQTSWNYELDPKNPGHYQRLLRELADEDVQLERIVHLWTFDENHGIPSDLEALENEQELGIYSLLSLVQAWAKLRAAGQVASDAPPAELLVVSNNLQAVSPDDDIACTKGSLRGLLQTIPQELPWLRCQHVDLPTGDVERNARQLGAEFQAPATEREVAYRQGKRWVLRIEKAELGQTSEQETPFKQGGNYLISGGLGGIGSEIARLLLQRYQARVLLIDRTPLPANHEQLDLPDVDEATRRRFETYQSLQQLDGDVAYEAVDICELQELAQAIERAEQQWQAKLDGVIHLAGSYHERQLADETREDFAGVLRPKLQGAWTLHQQLKQRPGSLFVSFSSVNGFWGGYSVGAYAAANSFLDALAKEQRRSGNLRSYSLAWSLWDEVGMSRGFQLKEATRSRGYRIIAPRQGINSFLAALHQQQPHLLVGLAADNVNIHQQLEDQVQGFQKLNAFYCAEEHETAAGELNDNEVSDRFGASCSFDLIKVPQVPRTNDDEINYQKLGADFLAADSAAPVRMEPGSELEKTIAASWQESLRLPNVDMHANLFDLGANSLLIGEVNGKLQKLLNRSIPMTAMFQHPTISALADYLAQTVDGSPSTSPRDDEASALSASQERGATRRERMRRRRQTPRGGNH